VAKDYDKLFKLFAEEDPRDLLALFAGIPPDAPITVKPLPREIMLPSLQVDHIYEVTTEAETFLVHFEVTTRFRAEVYQHAARQVQDLVSRYRMPVQSYFVILTEHGFPSTPIAPYTETFGIFRMEAAPEVICLWTIPASAVLDRANPRLYPWTVLLDATPTQQSEAYRRIDALKDRDLLARMALLGGLRYPNKERLFRRLTTMTEQEIIEESPFYKWVVENMETAKAEGEARGEARGETRQSRSILLLVLRARFGDSLPQSVLDRVASADTGSLERWVVQTLSASTLEEALA
jgi:hypothetical protein